MLRTPYFGGSPRSDAGTEVGQSPESTTPRTRADARPLSRTRLKTRSVVNSTSRVTAPLMASVAEASATDSVAAFRPPAFMGVDPGPTATPSAPSSPVQSRSAPSVSEQGVGLPEGVAGQRVLGPELDGPPQRLDRRRVAPSLGFRQA